MLLKTWVQVIQRKCYYSMTAYPYFLCLYENSCCKDDTSVPTSTCSYVNICVCVCLSINNYTYIYLCKMCYMKCTLTCICV